MANPVHPTLTDNAAQALGGTLDPRIGLSHMSLGQDDQSSPQMFTQLVTNMDVMYRLLARASQGAVIQSATPLTIEAYAIDYEIGGSPYSFVGGSLLLAASGIHKIYLDTAAILKSTTGSWPVDVVKLAIVTTDSAAVTNVQEARWQNFGLGVSNNWYNIPALSPPSLNGLAIKSVGALGVFFSGAVSITGGSATVNKFITPIRGEGNVADTLDTLVNGDQSGSGLVILTGDAGGGVITVTSTGNIQLAQGNFVLGASMGVSMLTLAYNATTSTWHEVARNSNAPTFLNATLFAFENWIRDLGGLDFGEASVTIAAGTFARTKTMSVILSETGTTDDLDTITGGTDNELLILRAGSGHTITIKHALMASGFSLANGKDFVLTSGGTLVCRYDGATNRWNEISRSPMKVSDLAGTDNAIYVPLMVAIPGALVLGRYFVRLKAAQAMVIKSVDVEVITAPAATPLIIDVEVNGLSMFNNQSEMAQVAVAATSGNSITKNKQVNAGETIQIEVEQPSGAADATVTLHTYLTAVPPVVGV